MAGIDHRRADIELRSSLAFTKTRQQSIYEALKKQKHILGVIILTTCNRTEVYFSCVKGWKGNPLLEICELLMLEKKPYLNICYLHSGNTVFDHICKLACGAKSQIWGEDQIITQVKTAWTLARELGSTDSVLEVLFRKAITAAKKIKTNCKLVKPGGSIANKTLQLIIKNLDPNAKILVIGCGEIGRMTAKLLLEQGYQVQLTIRQYKNGQVDVPKGVSPIAYEKRYEELVNCAAVISATSSPHYTLEQFKIEQLITYPRLFVDLAVPRDIEEAIGQLPGARLYDLDTICPRELTEQHQRQLLEIEEIIAKYNKDFLNWHIYREAVQS